MPLQKISVQSDLPLLKSSCFLTLTLCSVVFSLRIRSFELELHRLKNHNDSLMTKSSTPPNSCVVEILFLRPRRTICVRLRSGASGPYCSWTGSGSLKLNVFESLQLGRWSLLMEEWNFWMVLTRFSSRLSFAMELLNTKL